jgi:hypothetical protein
MTDPAHPTGISRWRLLGGSAAAAALGAASLALPANVRDAIDARSGVDRGHGCLKET